LVVRIVLEGKALSGSETRQQECDSYEDAAANLKPRDIASESIICTKMHLMVSGGHR
jgi:hypothetical protein